MRTRLLAPAALLAAFAAAVPPAALAQDDDPPCYIVRFQDGTSYQYMELPATLPPGAKEVIFGSFRHGRCFAPPSCYIVSAQGPVAGVAIETTEGTVCVAQTAALSCSVPPVR